MADRASLDRALDLQAPDSIFNLAGMSSVAESWRWPDAVGDINGVGAVRLLAEVALRARHGRSPRVVQASSAEIFAGSVPPHDERTALAPTSPYGAAKAYAHLAVGVYRSTGLSASSAILYNHESPRRPEHFVTRKISRGVARIAAGSHEQIPLGNLAARRDWGHARDYMRALTMIAAHPLAQDFVIATGRTHSVEDFVEAAFAQIGVTDWRRYVRVDDTLARPSEAHEQRGDAAKAHALLGGTRRCPSRNSLPRWSTAIVAKSRRFGDFRCNYACDQLISS